MPTKKRSSSKRARDEDGAGAGAGTELPVRKTVRSGLVNAARAAQTNVLEEAKTIFDKHFTTTDGTACNYVSTDDYTILVEHVKNFKTKSMYYWYLMYLEGRLFLKWDVERKNNKRDGEVQSNANGSVRSQLVVAFRKDASPFPWWDKYLAEFNKEQRTVRPGRPDLVRNLKGAPGMARFEKEKDSIYATDGRWSSVMFHATMVTPSQPARSGVDFRETIPRESRSQYDAKTLDKVVKSLTVMPTVFDKDELSLKTTMCAPMNTWLHEVVMGNILADCLRDPTLRAALHSGKTDFAAKLRAAEDEHNAETDPSSDEQYEEDVSMAICDQVQSLLGTENFRTPTKYISASGDRAKFEGNRRFYEALAAAHDDAGGCLSDVAAENDPASGLLRPDDIRISAKMPVIKNIEIGGMGDNIHAAVAEHFVCTQARKAGHGVVNETIGRRYCQQFIDNAVVERKKYEEARARGEVTTDNQWKYRTPVPGGYTVLAGGKHIEGYLQSYGIGTAMAMAVRFFAHNLGISFKTYKAFFDLRSRKGFKTPMGSDEGVPDAELKILGIDADSYFDDIEDDDHDHEGGAGAGTGAGNGFHPTSDPVGTGIKTAPSLGTGLLSALIDEDEDDK